VKRRERKAAKGKGRRKRRSFVKLHQRKFSSGNDTGERNQEFRHQRKPIERGWLKKRNRESKRAKMADSIGGVKLSVRGEKKPRKGQGRQNL